AVGSIKGWKNGDVLLLPALLLSAGGMLLAPVGKWLGNLVPEGVLLVSFSLLAVMIAVRMWRQAVSNPEQARVIRAGEGSLPGDARLLCPLGPNGEFHLQPRCLAGLTVSGMGIGLLSGLFGVGGGFMIVPLLFLMTGLSYSAAVATSLVVITLVSSIGFGSYLLMNETPPLDVLFQVAAGGVLGMLAGFAIGKKIAGAKLQQGFALALIIVIGVTLGRFFWF
ncbi:MAG: sulfite exporter TauE/SafE family protein, partial [Pseudomonadales bacterium]|nr:sulfite exporter TauE/SafE family protein [Pseudomonadales bacterium]